LLYLFIYYVFVSWIEYTAACIVAEDILVFAVLVFPVP